MAFNWPKYLSTLVLIFALLLSIVLTELPWWVDVAAGLVAVTSIWFFAASLAASWWVYDRSDLYEWAWLTSQLPVPRRWVNINTGFDETSAVWRRLFPSSAGTVVDLFDPPRIGEASIERARRRTPADASAIAAKPGALPLEDETVDCVFVVFAAHEMARHRDRDALFGEIRRALRADGVVVIVEHLLDLKNAAVFGPGAFHFRPRSIWLGHLEHAALELQSEQSKATFVSVFLAGKGSVAQTDSAS